MLTESLDDIIRLAGLVTEDVSAQKRDASIGMMSILYKQSKSDIAPKVDKVIAKSSVDKMYNSAKAMYIKKFGKAKFASSTYNIAAPIKSAPQLGSKPLQYGKAKPVVAKPLQYSKQSGPKTPAVKTGGSAETQTKNWMQRHANK